MRVSIPARLLMLGLVAYANEWGIVVYDPLQIKARIFPTDDVDIEALVNELVSVGSVVIFECLGKSYIVIWDFVERWMKQQRENNIAFLKDISRRRELPSKQDREQTAPAKVIDIVSRLQGGQQKGGEEEQAECHN
ncbi:MAG: hypothetical protein QXP49_06765 [Nitrososphaerota archaeon]